MESTLLILLDAAHLDQSLFMKSFAQKLMAFKKRRIILVHGDNSFSKELMKNGMNEHDAVERSVKEINLKLISLLAESGLSAIGIHGYQRNTVRVKNDSIEIDGSYLNSLPSQAVLILSNLVSNESGSSHTTMASALLANAISAHFPNSTCLCFALSEDARLSFTNDKPSEADLLNWVPEEVLRAGKSFYLVTQSDFIEPLKVTIAL